MTHQRWLTVFIYLISEILLELLCVQDIDVTKSLVFTILPMSRYDLEFKVPCREGFFFFPFPKDKLIRISVSRSGGREINKFLGYAFLSVFQFLPLFFLSF